MPKSRSAASAFCFAIVWRSDFEEDLLAVKNPHRNEADDQVCEGVGEGRQASMTDGEEPVNIDPAGGIEGLAVDPASNRINCRAE